MRNQLSVDIYATIVYYYSFQQAELRARYRPIIRSVITFSAAEIPRGDERDNLFVVYIHGDIINDYPFVIIEDPFNEDDYETTAELTAESGIQIVGDDLFTTNIKRVKYGIERNAANTVLLKVNQIGTLSEAFDTTLHYTPCKAEDSGFKTIVILPKDTNLPLDKPSDMPFLRAKNKWLIGHVDNEGLRNSGATMGVYGENLTIKLK